MQNEELSMYTHTHTHTHTHVHSTSKEEQYVTGLLKFANKAVCTPYTVQTTSQVLTVLLQLCQFVRSELDRLQNIASVKTCMYTHTNTVATSRYQSLGTLD